MNQVFNLNWLVEDIDSSYVMTLYEGDKTLGVYGIMDILTNGLDELNIRFANIDDLTHFVSHAIVRFAEIKNNDNVLDIPIRNLYMLSKYANGLGESDKLIPISVLEAFCVRNNEVLSEKITASIYKIAEDTENLEEVMNITKDFNSLGMNEKIDALEKINILNYKASNERF